MKKQIYRVLVYTLSFFIAAQLLPIKASSSLHYLMAGIILALVNMIIRPLLIILTIPLNLITLGLFTLVVNTWMIMLTSALLPGFYVPGFGIAFLVSIVIAFVNWSCERLYNLN